MEKNKTCVSCLQLTSSKSGYSNRFCEDLDLAFLVKSSCFDRLFYNRERVSGFVEIIFCGKGRLGLWGRMIFCCLMSRFFWVFVFWSESNLHYLFWGEQIRTQDKRRLPHFTVENVIWNQTKQWKMITIEKMKSLVSVFHRK